MERDGTGKISFIFLPSCRCHIPVCPYIAPGYEDKAGLAGPPRSISGVALSQEEAVQRRVEQSGEVNAVLGGGVAKAAVLCDVAWRDVEGPGVEAPDGAAKRHGVAVLSSGSRSAARGASREAWRGRGKAARS
jgi:hypothetical protein